MTELCSNYGEVSVLWFDGLEEHFTRPDEIERYRGKDVFASAKIWGSEKLFRQIRQLQPDILINNRCGMRADFDTPEQMIGAYQTDRAWESCITIGDQWAWKPNDRIKSLTECLHTLVRVAGGDGNLLFNVGPMPDGRIEARQVERLREMGAWLKQYGESIYATRGGPSSRAIGAFPPTTPTIRSIFTSWRGQRRRYCSRRCRNRLLAVKPSTAARSWSNRASRG